jgi:hypothetical protein
MSIPSSSIRTAAYVGSYGLKAINAPRKVGFSVITTSPALITSFVAEVQTLLAALDDQDVVGAAADAVPGDAFGDLLAELRKPVGCCVLQREGVLGNQQLIEDRVQVIHREQRRIGISAAERDDVRVSSKLEQFSDWRRTDGPGSFGRRTGRIALTPR